MATLSELIKELNALPKGDIYRKKINGRIYYYHQYFYRDKRYISIVKKEDLPELKAKIKRRKEIEKLIRSKQSRDVVLSKQAKELTGYVMNENVVTATFEKGILTYINDKLAPLIIKRTHSLEEFLNLRVMDMSRTNARILKKVLNINIDEDYKIALYAYALSVNDHYWFKPKNSKLTYQDVNVDDDSLFETSLKGESNIFFQKTRLSPEITTTGSFEKGWRYIDGEWWLYKAGNSKQYFSELFCSSFAKLIGVNTINYEMDNGYIRCLNFSSKYNFEPIASLADNNDQYSNVFNILYSLNKDIARDYLKLIFFDSVVNNVDRHNENVGLLRDIKSGKIISLAPNFDNNLALTATNDYLNDNPKKDGFIKFFVNFLKEDETARELFKTIKWKDIDIKDIQNIVDSINIDIENKENIVNAVNIRYNYLKDIF